jgi:hypothetical protein
VLYQLSYTHHAPLPRLQDHTGGRRSAVTTELTDGGPGLAIQAGGGTSSKRLAISLTVSESGPGWATKTASR